MLDELYQSIWAKLDQAVKKRQEHWHLVTVATIRNQEPEIRTMVLRGASQKENLLWMHTDKRSPKCEDIQLSSRGSLLFYDPIDRWQLRVKGVFSSDSASDITENAWRKTSASAKRCYQGDFTPGSISATPASNIPLEPIDSDYGRNNFTRLLFSATQMDWLFLRSEGHLRAKWEIQNQTVSGSWVNP